MVKCGINGFGRIGRISLRASLLKDSGVEIVQINDPFTPLDLMETLMNYDSAQGRFIHLAEADLKNNHLLNRAVKQIFNGAHFFVPWVKKLFTRLVKILFGYQKSMICQLKTHLLNHILFNLP